MARPMQIWFLVAVFAATHLATVAAAESPLKQRIGVDRGVCLFVGLPSEGKSDAIVALAKETELLIYVQSSSAEEVTSMRKAALQAKLLGKQIWVDQGDNATIQVAGNTADAVLVAKSATGEHGVPRAEVLRVLHPRANGYLGDEVIAKLVPAGVDDWSHPYHGPDNNTQSTDDLARYPYLTQFLGTPMFGCISENTVASGGRVYKAFGHIAFKKISTEVLNNRMSRRHSCKRAKAWILAASDN